ncbi:amino acid adenylation domain-containing protein [Kitasatospora sp. NPDC015120]|uniref:amino acid adenylation domain-containing protein n=1 Tax=Kitasatospora sp. NPDC015120 TaxID=3364023 RepID=UPI0036F49812
MNTAIAVGRVVELIEAQVDAAPEAVAVVAEGARLSYGELDRQANRIARRLIALGVRPDRPVGVMLPRGPELLPALLGVWKAGAAYLPLDLGLPAGRLEFMLADSGAAVLICRAGAAGRVPAGFTGAVLELGEDGPAVESDDSSRPERASDPEQLAYVIYTSGSTGTPKGVMVTHRSLLNVVRSVTEDVGAGPAGTWLAATSVSFDISALELYSALLDGGRVVLAPDADARNPAALLRLVAERGVSHVQATPSGWRLLLAAGFDRPDVHALVGGEALPVALAGELRRRVSRLTNVYGPTETTVWSSFWEVPQRPSEVLLGGPLANTRLHVLDGAGRPAGDGGTGELCIAGDGLARGYANRPDLTAERFVPDPWGEPGARMYRTGDLVRRGPGGALVFLGRIDTQVKISGYRIELGEIQARLIEHPGVRDAVVTVREAGEGDLRLIAYLVPVDRAPEVAALRAHLAASLPDYMIPSTFMAIARIPLSISGKVDLQALPAPARASRRPAGPGR